MFGECARSACGFVCAVNFVLHGGLIRCLMGLSTLPYTSIKLERQCGQSLKPGAFCKWQQLWHEVLVLETTGAARMSTVSWPRLTQNVVQLCLQTHIHVTKGRQIVVSRWQGLVIFSWYPECCGCKIFAPTTGIRRAAGVESSRLHNFGKSDDTSKEHQPPTVESSRLHGVGVVVPRCPVAIMVAETNISNKAETTDKYFWQTTSDLRVKY